ncbi:MAG TPA: alternative ribosome rescue aminoacyl-tRNA hydrolase ArfB [Sphingobacteriaceae bacterium]
MNHTSEFTIPQLAAEAEFRMSRSGGKGGQHVNKVSSRVELKFNIRTSGLFSPEEKELLLQKLSARLHGDCCIRVVSEEERSQLMNKQRALAKLFAILRNGLFREKERKPTKPGKAAVEKRLRRKLQQAEKKISRRKDYFENR